MAIYIKSFLKTIAITFSLFLSVAEAEPQNDRWDFPSQKESKIEREQIQIKGILLPEKHQKGEKNFSIQFVSLDGTQKYDVTNSPEITNLIQENESSYIVKINGELTPKFLFWGGDLVIKSFEILGKKPAPPHLVMSSSARGRIFEGGRR